LYSQITLTNKPPAPMKITKVSSYHNHTLYQVNYNGCDYNLEIRKIKDKIGTLLCCDFIGYFEVYGMKEVKRIIEEKLTNH